MAILKKLAGMVLLAGACALPQVAYAQQPIKIGVLNPFSGPLASPNTAQWQSGKMVTVFPKQAAAPGATFKSLARS